MKSGKGLKSLRDPMPDYTGGCEMAECVCRRDPKQDGKKGFCLCVDNKGELLRALRWWKGRENGRRKNMDCKRNEKQA